MPGYRLTQSEYALQQVVELLGNHLYTSAEQRFTQIYRVVFRFCELENIDISNNSSFRQKHPDVLDGSDGSDETSYFLTENYTLPVAYVLFCFVVTFTHHQKDTCVTLLAGAAVMLKPFTQRLAMLNHNY